MPTPWALRGLRNGQLTTRWPRHADEYFDTFRAGVEVNANPDASLKRQELANQTVLDHLCPTRALRAVEATGGRRGSDVVVDALQL